MKKTFLASMSSLALLLACSAGAGKAEDFSFDSAGVRIRYIAEGQGEPVLLIHGFALDLDINWQQPGIVKQLAGRYRVIAMDNRGHGQSGKPHEAGAYGMEMAEDAIRLMDHLKIGKAHVAGYSLGGRIASILLTEHPDRCLTATVAGAGWVDARATREREDLTVRIAESLEQGKGIGPLVLSLTPRNVTPPTPEQMEALNKSLLARNDPLALAAVMRGTGPLQAREAKLRANKLPVLVVAGELDPRREDAEALAGITPNSKLAIIPGANHMTAFARPAFIKELEAFLEGRASK
jgi:pimeloyl-ACP methyl ester carboxylesterase